MLLILTLLLYQVVLVQFSVGERFAAGAAMLSRLTASGPTAEPDGANISKFYTGCDGANVYGAANEVRLC